MPPKPKCHCDFDLWPRNPNLKWSSTSHDQPLYQVRRSLVYEFSSYSSDKVCLWTDRPTYVQSNIPPLLWWGGIKIYRPGFKRMQGEECSNSEFWLQIYCGPHVNENLSQKLLYKYYWNYNVSGLISEDLEFLRGLSLVKVWVKFLPCHSQNVRLFFLYRYCTIPDFQIMKFNVILVLY